MGCSSSHENVKSCVESKKRWIGPELLDEKYFASSLITTQEMFDTNFASKSSIFETEANITLKNVSATEVSLPKLEFFQKNLGYEITHAAKFSDEPLAIQNFGTNGTSATKIDTSSSPEKLNLLYLNEPEMIDVCKLMEGLEDAENLSCSSFRISRPNNHRRHHRSTSFSGTSTKSPVSGSRSRRKRQPVSESHHHRVKFHPSVFVNAEVKNVPSREASRLDMQICRAKPQDTVPIIKQVIENPVEIKPQTKGILRNKLPVPDSSSIARKNCSQSAIQVDSPDQVYPYFRADISEICQHYQFSINSMVIDQSNQMTEDLPGSFNIHSSSENFSKGDENLSVDAADEFSFGTQIPQNDIKDNYLNDFASSNRNKNSDARWGEIKSVENSIFFPNNPLQSMKYVNLHDFEKLTPPRGENRVVLYSTSSCVTRKNFEDCNLVRQILYSYNTDLDERDLSLHPEFTDELQNVTKTKSPVSVPRLFIKGRHVGGTDEVCLLHKAKALERLLQVFSSEYVKALCVCCGGTRTLQCLGCNGVCWIKTEEDDVLSCNECEKKGWIMCPICS